MGHSMGGGECLQYAARGPPSVRKHIRGYISAAPLIKLDPKTQPWRITEVVGRAAVRVMPNFHLVQKLDERLLCRDPALCAEYRTDELVHNTGTLEGMGGMLDRGNELADGRVVVKEDARPVGETAVIVMHGDMDGITAFDASKEWVEKCEVKDKEFKAYDGWYHVCEFGTIFPLLPRVVQHLCR